MNWRAPARCRKKSPLASELIQHHGRTLKHLASGSGGLIRSAMRALTCSLLTSAHFLASQSRSGIISLGRNRIDAVGRSRLLWTRSGTLFRTAPDFFRRLIQNRYGVTLSDLADMSVPFGHPDRSCRTPTEKSGHHRKWRASFKHPSHARVPQIVKPNCNAGVILD